MPTPRLAWPSGRLPAAFGVVVLAGLTALPAWTVVATWREREAQARTWNMAGPACPALAEMPARVPGRHSPQFFEYRGTSFGRRGGEADCAAPPAGAPLSPASYTACRFTDPELLIVKTAEGESLFAPGPGRPAVVTLRQGRVACVLAAPPRG